MEYTIVNGQTPEGLEQIVNQYIVMRWEPLGGPICSSEGSNTWYQALIRKSPVYGPEQRRETVTIKL